MTPAARAIFALGLLAVGAAPAVRAAEPPEARAAGRPCVAVAPLQNDTGNPGLDWVGTGTAEALVTELAASGRFRVVERDRLEAIVAELELGFSGLVDPDTAQRVGELLGADFLVVGSFQKSGTVLRLQARRVELASRQVREVASVSGQEDGIFALQSELAAQLLAQLPREEVGGR